MAKTPVSQTGNGEFNSPQRRQADVAQWPERFPGTEEIAGSNPAVGSIHLPPLEDETRRYERRRWGFESLLRYQRHRAWSATRVSDTW